MRRLKTLVRELRHYEVPVRDWPRVTARLVVARKLANITPIAAVEDDGLRIVVDTRDKVVAPWTFALGGYARPVMERALDQLARRDYSIDGRAVLEAGANMGTETVALVIRHGAGVVVAVEPEPRNLDVLRMNVAANRLDGRVLVLPIALSDVDGAVTVELSPTNMGDHRVRVGDGGGGRDGESSRDTIEVPARRLDTLIRDGSVPNDIALAWIDVQGHEGHVLAGGSALRSVPVVVEFWPYALRRAEGMERFVAAVTGREVIDLATGRPARLDDLPDHPAAATDLLLLPS